VPTTIVFDLITQLYEKAKATVPNDVMVHDGLGVPGNPGNFLMVGVPDPDTEGPPESASGTQEWKGLGARAATEEGAVTCCALAWSGDSGDEAQRAAREKVRDIVAGLDATLKADPNLGGTVPGLNWVRYGRNFGLTQLSDTDGVSAIFYFEIAYLASI
jgi:hypothetical protein